ncbi:hypothetical protein INT47_010339, partial [Mucor saturninus]
SQSTGPRSISIWFVGVAHCYFRHKQEDDDNFLAIVEVMKQWQFDTHNVVTVAQNSRVVGLVRYSDSANIFKVAWPYTKYTDKVDHRPAGSVAYL